MQGEVGDGGVDGDVAGDDAALQHSAAAPALHSPERPADSDDDADESDWIDVRQFNTVRYGGAGRGVESRGCPRPPTACIGPNGTVRWLLALRCSASAGE